MTMASGYYPAGAENNPHAPWNSTDDFAPRKRTEECADCNGKGKFWTAYDRLTDMCIDCAELTWGMIPDTEEEAKERGEHYYKGEVYECETCGGSGVIEKCIYDCDGEYDDDRHDELLERHYAES